MENLLREGERVEPLGGGISVIQHPERYTFTSDSILLSRFARVLPGMRIADIGAGSGVISLLLAKRAERLKIFAVEAQPYMADMCARSVALSGLSDAVEVISGRIQDNILRLGRGSLDAVVTNPPYMKSGACDESALPEIACSRHDSLLPLPVLADCCRSLLKFSGKLFMIYPASRLAELIEELHAAGIEPKRLQLVSARAGRPPDVALLEGVRGGRRGLAVLPELHREKA